MFGMSVRSYRALILGMNPTSTGFKHDSAYQRSYHCKSNKIGPQVQGKFLSLLPCTSNLSLFVSQTLTKIYLHLWFFAFFICLIRATPSPVCFSPEWWSIFIFLWLICPSSCPRWDVNNFGFLFNLNVRIESNLLVSILGTVWTQSPR